jgi:hypothetical protein
MADAPRPTQRWFRLTTDRLLLGLLAFEGFLFLSERFHWFAFNQHKGWTVLIAVASVGVAMLLMLVWLAAGLVFRWRFQFSIRSLLVLTVAVALPCSWLSWEMKGASKQTEAVQEIYKLGGSSGYDFEAKQGGNPFAIPPGPAWLINLLEVDFFGTVVSVDVGLPSTSHAGLAHLEALAQLQSLGIHGTGVTDAALARLAALTQLQGLDLSGTPVTDAGWNI